MTGFGLVQKFYELFCFYLYSGYIILFPPFHANCIIKILKIHLLLLLFTFQSAIPQKGSEVNLTLGGIDLNNSGRLACFLKFQSYFFILAFFMQLLPWGKLEQFN